jgi:WD40 repeat protein
LDCFHR